MGIAKIGGKIGGIDVNINMPRDKSLDNVGRMLDLNRILITL